MIRSVEALRNRYAKTTNPQKYKKKRKEVIGEYFLFVYETEIYVSAPSEWND